MKKIFSIGLSLFVAAIILSGCSKTEETESAKIPENCTSWFDGCNTCFVKDGEIGGCTRMACEKNTEPKCTQFENEPAKEAITTPEDTNKEEVKIPENCTSWFDGCNNCTVKDWKADACTMMYCEKNTEPKCNQFKE